MDYQDEDDLYSDLPSFKYNETLDKLQSANKNLLAKVSELEAQIANLTKENSECREKCTTLMTNISSIYKTAQSEIKRKDKRINELNREIITLKTRSFRLKRMRSNADLSNEDSNKPFKKAKVDKTEKPVAVKPTEVDKPASNSINDSYSTPTVRKDSFRKSEEAVKEVRVPNISCPTLYSQRMFKKIYNTEPANKVSKDSENDRTFESTLSSKEIQSKDKPVEHPVKLGDINTPVSEVKPKSSSTSEALKTDLSENRNPDTQNSEQNNNLKVLTNLNSEEEFYPAPPDNKKKDTASDFNSVNIPSNLQEVSTNIPVQELRSIMSNVINSDIKKESQLTKKTDSLMSKDKTITSSNKVLSDTSKSHDVKSKTQVKRNDSDSMINDAFGLKLLNRPKTNFCPISGQWSAKVQKNVVSNQLKPLEHQGSPVRGKNNCDDKKDIMEDLFGSPLKWTENSEEDAKPTPKLNPPLTAYEDSCSAQIENSKFHKFNCLESSYLKTVKETSVQRSETFKECTDSKSVKNFQSSESLMKSHMYLGIEKLEDIPTRIFEQDKDQTPSFSAFADRTTIGKEDCVIPSLSLSADQSTPEATQEVKGPPKYNDSILGQFDDTTQLISALARDHSKISPIHTPIKESKCESISSPESKYELKGDLLINKSDIEVNQSTKKIKPVSHLATQGTDVKKTERKTILLDSPINILHPRKTPRNISDKRTRSPKKGSRNTSTELSSITVTGDPNKETEGVCNSAAFSGIKESTLLKPANFKVSSVSYEVIERVCAIKRKLKCKKKVSNESTNVVNTDGQDFPVNLHNEEKNSPQSPIIENLSGNNLLQAKEETLSTNVSSSVNDKNCPSPSKENFSKNCSLPAKEESIPRTIVSSVTEESPKSCFSSSKKESSPETCPLSVKEESCFRRCSPPVNKDCSPRRGSSSGNKESSSERCSPSGNNESSSKRCSSSRKESSPRRSSSDHQESFPKRESLSDRREGFLRCSSSGNKESSSERCSPSGNNESSSKRCLSTRKESSPRRSSSDHQECFPKRESLSDRREGFLRCSSSGNKESSPGRCSSSVNKRSSPERCLSTRNESSPRRSSSERKESFSKRESLSGWRESFLRCSSSGNKESSPAICSSSGNKESSPRRSLLSGNKERSPRCSSGRNESSPRSSSSDQKEMSLKREPSSHWNESSRRSSSDKRENSPRCFSSEKKEISRRCSSSDKKERSRGCSSSDKKESSPRCSSPKERYPRNHLLSPKEESAHRGHSLSTKKENSLRSCSKREYSARSRSSSAKKENSPRTHSSSFKKDNSPRSFSSATKDSSRHRSSSAIKDNSLRSHPAKEENSPKSFSTSIKKENLPRGSSPLAKKENFPYRFKKEDRSFKKSSYHFKKPSCYYSRQRENCRFRHSSVERKLLKDHRHTNRIRSTPVRVIKEDEGIDSNYQNTSNNQERNSSQTNISSPDVELSKNSLFPSKFDNLKLKYPLNFDNSQSEKSPASVPAVISQQQTTYIRRSTKKIEWSSTTSDVISTISTEDTPQVQKTESKMKWFLQPIDFNVAEPVGNIKSMDKTCTDNVSSPGNCEKLLSPDPPLNCRTPNKTSLMPQGIVIVSRRRPAKFGVSEMSDQSCLKVEEL